MVPFPASNFISSRFPLAPRRGLAYWPLSESRPKKLKKLADLVNSFSFRLWVRQWSVFSRSRVLSAELNSTLRGSSKALDNCHWRLGSRIHNCPGLLQFLHLKVESNNQFQTLCLGNTFHLISKPWQHPLDELRSVTPQLSSCPCHLIWNAGNAPLKVTLRLSRWRPFPSPLPPCLSSPEHVSGTASSLNPC